MGEAQQTAWKLIRDGKLGPVRVIYAECNWEGSVGTPRSFTRSAYWGRRRVPALDPTGIFGPARCVLAYGRTLYPNRVTMDGTPFTTEAGLDDGDDRARGWAGVRLTANFYVGLARCKGHGFHGDDGSRIASWQDYWRRCS
ncbi:MAG: hypothetical protein WKH64_02855 [Chloroflexia bacterium]